MTFAKKLSRLVSELTGEKNSAVIPLAYLRAFGGDLATAYVLKEITYWSNWKRERDPESDGWFYRSLEDWRSQAFITRDVLNRTLKRLEVAGVETKLAKVDGAPTRHFRVNEDVFSRWLSGLFGYEESSNSNCGNPTNGNAGNPQNLDMRETRNSLPIPLDTPTDTPPVTTPQAAGEQDEPTPDQTFQTFWRLYPRHVKKPKALEAWEKLNPDEELREQIFRAIALQCENNWKGKDQQYIPHPTTWINGGQWDDDIEPPEDKTKRNGSRSGWSVQDSADYALELERQGR